jgi:hypothetical protein
VGRCASCALTHMGWASIDTTSVQPINTSAACAVTSRKDVRASAWLGAPHCGVNDDFTKQTRDGLAYS